MLYYYNNILNAMTKIYLVVLPKTFSKFGHFGPQMAKKLVNLVNAFLLNIEIVRVFCSAW